jgi:hypothetical protein
LFSLAAQQSSKESFRSALIPTRLNQDVDQIAVLIHGTPQILLLAVDSNENFVQVQNIAEAALTPLQFSSVIVRGGRIGHRDSVTDRGCARLLRLGSDQFLAILRVHRSRTAASRLVGNAITLAELVDECIGPGNTCGTAPLGR